MATATFTWAAWDTTNAWQNLADCAQSAAVYARDAEGSAKFTFATKNTTVSEFGRKGGAAAAGDSWQSIFGIAAGQVITQVRVSAWKTKMVANTKLSSHTLTVKIVDDSGNTVTDANLLNAVALRNAAGESSFTSETAGSNVNVLSASQAGATSVRLSLEYSVTTSGGGSACSCDTRFDDVTIEITYQAAPSFAVAGAWSTKTITGGIG